MARRSDGPNYTAIVALAVVALVALFINSYIDSHAPDYDRDETTLKTIRHQEGLQ